MKRKTARIVLSRECNITNCYTLEASFHGHFDHDRVNYEFSEASYQEMGKHLVTSLYEYMVLLEEENKFKREREAEKKRKRNELRAAQTLKMPKEEGDGQVRKATK